MLLLPFFLAITLFLSNLNVAALSITVQSNAIVGQPSSVVWARQLVDGTGLLVFDLRFVRPGPPSEDVGLALAIIQAPPSVQTGTVQVVFPSPGSYRLVAVTGTSPEYTNIGESDVVNAVKASTPTSSTSKPIPSATTSAKPTSTPATTSAKPTSTPSRARRTKNLGAIIGGTLGGVAFLGLLVALAIVLLRRRQPTVSKRWTFHRDMMVLPPVLDIRPVSPTLHISPFRSVEDIEQGLPHDNSSTSPVVMIASPSGPRPLLKPLDRPLPVLPRPLKPGQEEVVEQIEQLRNQMLELEKNAGPTQHIMLDDMQKRISWLQSQLGS